MEKTFIDYNDRKSSVDTGGLNYPPHSQTNVNSIRYGSLDGLRAYAAIGIVLMHVLVNIVEKPSDCYITTSLIPFFTNFTLLFMVVSGFSLCCGYYTRIKEGTITPAAFYRKRYLRILPFFALLCFIDLALKPSMGAFCEVYANLTLCFSLIPSFADIEVIGVGWFLGVVFLFYMLFPFYVFMLDNKSRGWLSILLALGFVLTSMVHFDSINKNCMVFCAPLFMAGGMAYLYKDQIGKFVSRHRIASAAVTTAFTIFFFISKGVAVHAFTSYVSELLLFTLWLIYAIGSKDAILNNRFVRYLSGISMEIYLCHMAIFRAVEMLHLENIISQNDLLYVVVCIATLLGAICFAHVAKYHVIEPVMRKVEGK